MTKSPLAAEPLLTPFRRSLLVSAKLLAVGGLLWGGLALADEGMWTFNNFPAARVKEKYGFAPSKAWLDKVQLSSARMAEGCSASFVSPNGLVMFNHHCAQECIQQLSTAEKDYVAAGFWAKTEKDEVKCPALEIDQLTDIHDVTGRVSQATAGLSGAAYEEARKRIDAQLEGECAGGNEKVRCEVVSLYHGGEYDLYRYRRYLDTRLVFAPELAIAYFGGDPDNFTFPRYDLDVSFVRVYEDGQPARTENYFRWSPAGAREGDLTFVSGNPGSTFREWTVAELEYERDFALPDRLLLLAQLRGLLTEFQELGPEEKRISTSRLLYTENSFKALHGMFEALVDKSFFATKVAAEQAFRAKVAADPSKKAYAEAWEAVAEATARRREIRQQVAYVGFGQAFSSELFSTAQSLVRAAEERTKPDGDRLPEYSEARLPQMKAHLLSKAPIYKEFEILKLTFSLTKMREELGPDDPYVKKVLGKKSPKELATELVGGTKLYADQAGLALRQALWGQGQKAIDASTDPMIAFARRVDPDARAVRKRYEDDIESVIKKNDELIAKARFEIYGTSHYPDATFTPRLSYGSIEGYRENGHEVKPFTTLGGAFQRATGVDPFRLPESWLKAEALLDKDTPLDFCTNNDVIGGNSGSPVINRDAEIVGLIFDGNIQSLGGDFGFDASVNRAVAVDSQALLETLDKVYGALRLVNELRPASSARTGM